MIRGGMFAVDLPLFYSKTKRKEFTLRFDTDGNYNRKILTNNGRTATTYVFKYGIKIKEDEEVLIPEYNCISVINAIEAVKASFRFYKIKGKFEIDLEDLEKKITSKTKVLYIIHYFGVPHSKDTVEKLCQIAQKHNLIIVEDLTQTLLCGATDRIGFGDYIVSSVRKWFPIADGGIVAARNNVPFDMVQLPEDDDASIIKQMELSVLRYCYDKRSMTDISYYLQMEKEANKSRYIDFNPRKITECSRTILEKCDMEKAVEMRCSNYRYLYERLENISQVKILSDKLSEDKKFVPFGLLIETEQRDKLYHYLAEHLIVGEIQWKLPREYYTPSQHAAYISEHSLMLQVDQRYDKKDMDYIYETVKAAFEILKGED